MRLDAEEQATVQAQIAGIQVGASPNAYAADIAARRKDLEDRCGVLSPLWGSIPEAYLSSSNSATGTRDRYGGACAG